MPPLVRNILAVVIGIVSGGLVNMALIGVSGSIVPPPPGVDVTDPASLRASIHLFEPRHFVMPFLAHALGTLTGALAAYLTAVTNRTLLASIVSAFFLIGGIAAAFMIPAPAWFIALDLVVAYLPMGWLAARIGKRMTAPDTGTAPG